MLGDMRDDDFAGRDIIGPRHADDGRTGADDAHGTRTGADAGAGTDAGDTGAGRAGDAGAHAWSPPWWRVAGYALAGAFLLAVAAVGALAAHLGSLDRPGRLLIGVCPLFKSDAADAEESVDMGGRTHI